MTSRISVANRIQGLPFGEWISVMKDAAKSTGEGVNVGLQEI